MIRRPPRSTLFPTRRSSDLDEQQDRSGAEAEGATSRRLGTRREAVVVDTRRHDLDAAGVGAVEALELEARSEEHTSELQSRVDLVCRLLLEKKKKQQTARKQVERDAVLGNTGDSSVFAQYFVNAVESVAVGVHVTEEEGAGASVGECNVRDV